jgi:tryptophan-rich sensory protein
MPREAAAPPLWKPLIGFVAVCLIAGWLGGLVTETSVRTWYPTLAKPAWTPPNLAFPIVWTILYVVMGIAAALAWTRAARPDRIRAMLAFGLQLGLSCLWTTLFFGLQSPSLALIDLAFLLLAIIATSIAFRRISGLAALLLVPYLLWAGFAMALNYEIWRLN